MPARAPGRVLAVFGPNRYPALRILVASPFLPHAAAGHGGGVYLHAFLTALAAEAEVSLCCFTSADELRARAEPPAGLHLCRTVVRRTRQEIGLPRLPANWLRMAARWGPLRLPLAAAKFASKTMHAVLRDAARELDPDVALCELGLMAQYLPDLAGRVTVLTDHEAADPVPARIGPFGIGRGRDRRLWERYVERFYRSADLLQALTTQDARRLSERLRREVEVRPPVVGIPAAELCAEPAKAPPRMLFLGDYSHHPNPESAVYLVKEVLPRVLELEPAAELWLAGPRATPAVRALGSRPGARVLGFAPDLAALFDQVRCMVAPVFSGSGSRIKVLTALAHGLPVVANELGLRGVHAPRHAARRGATAEELARAAAELLAKPDVAGAAGRRARRWAETNLSAAAIARQQVRRFERLCAAMTGR